jgi:hypothetical protein
MTRIADIKEGQRFSLAHDTYTLIEVLFSGPVSTTFRVADRGFGEAVFTWKSDTLVEVAS